MKTYESSAGNGRTAMRYALEKAFRIRQWFCPFAVRENTENFPADDAAPSATHAAGKKAEEFVNFT